MKVLRVCKPGNPEAMIQALCEETAFSMSKIHFNANDEGTILQSNRNARMSIQYKWTQLVKRGHLQELRKMRDNKQVLKIIRSVRNTKHGRLVWPST